MFRKKIINASSNLKMGLDLGTKIKSNGWLDIGTKGVYLEVQIINMHQGKNNTRSVFKYKQILTFRFVQLMMSVVYIYIDHIHH
jgi:hypothetical protein